MDFPIIIIRVSPLSFLGASEVIFSLDFIQFFDVNSLSKRIAPDGTLCSAASHLGLFVCLCPIKGMPGLHELKTC